MEKIMAESLYEIDFDKDLLDLAAEVEADIRARQEFENSAWAWKLAQDTADAND